MIQGLAKNWWLLALRGVLAILFALVTFLWPQLTGMLLVLWFGAYLLLDGLFNIISVIRTRNRQSHWWAFIFEGLVAVSIGLVTFLWPAVTAFGLIYIVALWAVLAGVLRVFAGIRLRQHIRGGWMLILSGVLATVFGILLFAFPAAGILALIWVIGSVVLAVGLWLLLLAFRLRSLGRQWFGEQMID